jgi:hypothetical protein
MAHYLKHPGSSLDYTIDWNAGYLDTETVTASSWSISPQEIGGLAIIGEIQTGLRTTVVLSGGVAGHFYQVENEVVLSNGHVDTRSISLRIEQR